LQPTRNQLASSQQQQASVAEDVAQTAADVQRAARHERRLNNAALSAEIQRAGEGIERVAQNEASNAESELEQATSEAEQMESALVNNESAPGNTETLQAQQALAASESALSQQAQQLGETLQPLLAQAEAAAANEPNGGPSGDPMPTDNPDASATPLDGNSTPSNSESGSPLGQQDPGGALQSNQSPSSQPSFTEAELARGQQLARMLDELDQQRAAAEANAKAGDQPNGELAQANSSRPTSLALSAQAQRAAQAATRQRSQQQAMMAMNEGRTTEAMGFSDPTTPSQFELTDVARNENTDWGKLRSKSATELTRGSSEAVSEEYRMSVEAYFRVLSERSRNESK
jgi:hypothetical protein